MRVLGSIRFNYIGSLSFYSSSRELNFTVSGPSGTTGHINATVVKTLISEIADIKGFIDGEETDYTATSKDESWLLHFTYHLSTLTVITSLGPKPLIPPQLITPLTLIIITVCLAIATAAIILKIRKGAPPTNTKRGFGKCVQT